MPIHCPMALNPVSDTDFNTIDRLVMAASYASQNHLGRLCDERVYENDVAARLLAGASMEVHTQVPVTVTHHTFIKTYWLDLVVDQMIYEFKSAAMLAPAHEAQAIHYAALVDTNRVKLVNFGSTMVFGHLLRTPFSEVNRRQITVARDRWQPLSDECTPLIERLTALLEDWGAFLEGRLYEEALVHFFGGESQCEQRLPVSRDGITLGAHRQSCHAHEVGFVVTTLGKEAAAYEEQLLRLLASLPLQAIQWLNLNHAELQAVTLLNAGRSEAAR